MAVDLVNTPADEWPKPPPVEFLPWYHPTAQFTRCSICGSVIMSGEDQEQHVKFHETLRALGKSLATVAEGLLKVLGE